MHAAGGEHFVLRSCLCNPHCLAYHLDEPAGATLVGLESVQQALRRILLL